MDHIGIPGYQTFCGSKSSNFLENELSKDDDMTLYIRPPFEWRIWIQDLSKRMHQLLGAEFTPRVWV